MKRLFLSLFVIMTMNAMHDPLEHVPGSESPELSLLELYNPTDTVVDFSGFESSPYHETTPLTSRPSQCTINNLLNTINNLDERVDQLDVRTSRFQLALLGISTCNFLLASYAIYNTWSPGE